MISLKLKLELGLGFDLNELHMFNRLHCVLSLIDMMYSIVWRNIKVNAKISSVEGTV